MTLKMKGETDVTAGRTMAAEDVELAAGIAWMRNYDGCSGCGQKP